MEQNKNVIPLFEQPVSAGFASPAEDSIEKKLDIHDLLISHPAATFFVRVQGDSMVGAGILDGDVLIVDRALTPSEGKIVIAVINGEFTVKRISFKKGYFLLVPENPRFAPIKVTEETDCTLWGVVTYAIHSL